MFTGIQWNLSRALKTCVLLRRLVVCSADHGVLSPRSALGLFLLGSRAARVTSACSCAEGRLLEQYSTWLAWVTWGVLMTEVSSLCRRWNQTEIVLTKRRNGIGSLCFVAVELAGLAGRTVGQHGFDLCFIFFRMTCIDWASDTIYTKQNSLGLCFQLYHCINLLVCWDHLACSFVEGPKVFWQDACSWFKPSMYSLCRTKRTVILTLDYYFWLNYKN